MQAIGRQRHAVAFALQQSLGDAPYGDRIVDHEQLVGGQPVVEGVPASHRSLLRECSR